MLHVYQPAVFKHLKHIKHRRQICSRVWRVSCQARPRFSLFLFSKSVLESLSWLRFALILLLLNNWLSVLQRSESVLESAAFFITTEIYRDLKSENYKSVLESVNPHFIHLKFILLFSEPILATEYFYHYIYTLCSCSENQGLGLLTTKT